MKLAGWIAYDRLSGDKQGNLAVNEAKLAQLQRDNAGFLSCRKEFATRLGKEITRIKYSGEVRRGIRNQAAELAGWISHDESRGDTKSAAVNQD